METTNSFLKKGSTLLKAFIVGILVLLMLIPVTMVKSLVTERQNSSESVREEITAKWGGQQQITGPILVIPYQKSKGEEHKYETGYAYFLPDDYKIDGEIFPEERSRGIYEVMCYKSDMKISGNFNFPDVGQLNLNPDTVLWKDAFLLLGIPDLQGIRNKIVFNVNGQSQEVLASVSRNDIISSGLTVKMPLEPEEKKIYKFDFNLSLNGSNGLYFTPIGKQTSVHVTSDYKPVTFIGDFLPNTRNLDGPGFDAQWDIFDYNRNYAQMWVGPNMELRSSTLGVDLLLPVDHYQKNMRSAKYAIMFIALTFMVFFIVELKSRKSIHPIQYLLVSFALVLFYSLLLAFSEHIGFDLSYLVSALAIISLITAYSWSIFKNKKETFFMGIFLTVLYSFLYVVIQLEDMALLLGSVGLFIALASVMYASRNVNWEKKEIFSES